MNRILVVGGSGFIGRHLCRTALARGYAVTSLALHEQSSLPDSIMQLKGDLSNGTSIKQQLADQSFEFIVNCGGYIDHRSFFSGGRNLIQAHFDGVQNLLDAVDRDGLKRFVQIGSSDEYGNATAPQSETKREAPISPYSLAKTAATHFLQMLWRTDRFPAVVLRLFLVYGPGQDTGRFLPQIIHGCLQDRRFSVSEGGQLRDFTYVDDIVEGIFSAFDVPEVYGQVVNLATGIPVTIRSMIEKVRSIIGTGEPEFGMFPYRPGENMALWADTKLARELLNWTPKVSLEEGLTKTIEYCRNENSAI